MPQLNGPFVSTTSIFDVNDVRNLDVNSEAFKQFLVLLYQQVNNHAVLLNSKDHGWYSLQTYNCGKQWFPETGTQNRGVGRTTINFGALPNNNTTPRPHGINFNADTRIVRIEAVANNTTTQQAIPIPYSVVPGNGQEISIWVDNMNVYIRTTNNFSQYNFTYVILEYTT